MASHRVLAFLLAVLVSCDLVTSEIPSDDFDIDENDDTIVFNTGHFGDKEHLKEHHDSFLDIDFDQMEQDEIRFHYFRHHDFDKNKKLDGWELLATLEHASPPNFEVSEAIARSFQTDQEKDSWVIRNWINKSQRTIDRTMKNHDENSDGYLTYNEYVKALDKKSIKLST